MQQNTKLTELGGKYCYPYFTNDKSKDQIIKKNYRKWHKLLLLRIKANKNIKVQIEIHNHAMNFSLSPWTLQLLPTMLSYYTNTHLHTISWSLIFILQIVFLSDVNIEFMALPKSNLINSLDWSSQLSSMEKFDSPLQGLHGQSFSSASLFPILISKNVTSLSSFLKPVKWSLCLFLP